MIFRLKGHLLLKCDECQHELETDKDDLGEAVEFAKEQDWEVHRRDTLVNPPTTTSRYIHTCQNCSPHIT